MKNSPAVIPQRSPLTIGSITIHQDQQGRYCLNDLHKASGGHEKHSPNRWTRTDGYKSLISEITPDLAFSPVVSKQQLGTFVCKELVYAYAMWISAAFNLKVIRAYDSLVTTPACNDPIIMMRMEQIALEQRTTQLEHQMDAIKPRLTASAITTVLGTISRVAKIYRQAQAIKHIKVSVPESTEYFRLLLYEKYEVADIGYLSDIKAACKFLQAEGKRYQEIVNEWYNRNNLFSGGAA